MNPPEPAVTGLPPATVQSRQPAPEPAHSTVSKSKSTSESKALRRSRGRTVTNLAVLQVGGLAGPGAAAGGVWVVARTQSDALAGLGAEVELLGGWLGVLPDSQSAPATARKGRLTVPVRLFRMRRPVPRAGLRAPISLALPRHVRRATAVADVAHVHLCRDFVT